MSTANALNPTRCERWLPVVGSQSAPADQVAGKHRMTALAVERKRRGDVVSNPTPKRKTFFPVSASNQMASAAHDPTHFAPASGPTMHGDAWQGNHRMKKSSGVDDRQRTKPYEQKIASHQPGTRSAIEAQIAITRIGGYQE